LNILLELGDDDDDVIIKIICQSMSKIFVFLLILNVVDSDIELACVPTENKFFEKDSLFIL